MVRYYGHNSNVFRRRRKKENRDSLIPSVLQPVESPSALSSGPKGLQVERPDEDSKAYRKNWARLIQKIHLRGDFRVELLAEVVFNGACPRCQGRMKVISFIEDLEFIRKILEHLGLWLVKRRPQPRANAPPVNIHLDYSDSQIPPFEDSLYKDLDYPIVTHAF